jgi:hypothetical protein
VKTRWASCSGRLEAGVLSTGKYRPKGPLRIASFKAVFIQTLHASSQEADYVASEDQRLLVLRKVQDAYLEYLHAAVNLGLVLSKNDLLRRQFADGFLQKFGEDDG